MAQLIAKRYALALFDLAIEKNCINDFENQVQTMYRILNSEEEFMKVLQHPQVLRDEKIKLIQGIFSSKIADELIGLLILVIQKNRQDHILDILNVFLDQVKAYKGIVSATVISAVPLSKEQINQITQKLIAGLKKKVEIQLQIDPSIIGGLKIRVGDQILDSSIEGKLHSLKAELNDLQLV